MHILPSIKSNSIRNNVLNEQLALGFRQPVELLVRLPLVEQMPERHEPHLQLRAVELAHPVIDQPGKQLLVAYPACTFFPASSSLRM